MAMRLFALGAGLTLVSLGLQGCGSKSDDNKPAPPETTTTTTPKVAPGPEPPHKARDFHPVRGISYEVPPGTSLAAGVPAKDYMQANYANQWGKGGRDDLGMIYRLGASSVRVYDGFGLETSNHGLFLDRAQELGLNVIVGFHTQNICPGFNCFDSWKKAAANGFKKAGFVKNGTWHPAVKMVILMDQPDNLNFMKSASDPSQEVCGTSTPPTEQEKGPCRTRAVLSGLEGFLSAEADAGLNGDGVYLGVAWSFDNSISIDGKINEPMAAYWGFEDIMAGVATPAIAQYKQNTSIDLKAVYESRWVNAINAPSTWTYIKEKVFDGYHNYSFSARPWMVTGYAPTDDGEATVQQDLIDMDAATKNDTQFWGVTFKGFQVDQTASPPGEWGLFGLGSKKIADVKPCQTDVASGRTDCPATFPVLCLDSTTGHFLSDLTEAWSGVKDGHGVCLTSWNEEEAMMVV